MTENPAAKKPSFEEALEQLERIVRDMEAGKVPLEESIAKYEQGTKLVAQCRAILDQAERKIQQLSRGEDGELTVEGELSESD